MTAIPYGRQDIDDRDIEAVVEVLRSDWLTQGPTIEQFEAATRKLCGASHAVAVASATAALHIACRAIGLGPGSTLWTSPNTFVASSNAALYCGASIDFVDIDARTYNLSIGALERKLSTAEREGRLPAAVMPVHFGGQPCDMAAIAALARRYGFRVIEDASHAIGAGYPDGAPVGAGNHSDITVFSFHPVKIITTGEGGMAVTNDAELAARMRLLRSHGITRDAATMERESDGAWYYEQIDLGFNYRMTDLQAALGLSQLRRLRDFVHRRSALAARYRDRLAALPLDMQRDDSGAQSAWHLFVVRLHDPSRRASVFDYLSAHGIRANVHYIPVHTQPYYRKLGFRDGDFPESEAYYRGAMTLPLFPKLSEADQDKVIAAISRALS